MIVNCVWEHNGKDTLLYATNLIGAYTRGESLEIAKAKMPQEIVSYCKWLGVDATDEMEIMIVGEKCSDLAIRDADSDLSDPRVWRGQCLPPPWRGNRIDRFLSQ